MPHAFVIYQQLEFSAETATRASCVVTGHAAARYHLRAAGS